MHDRGGGNFPSRTKLTTGDQRVCGGPSVSNFAVGGGGGGADHFHAEKRGQH